MKIRGLSRKFRAQNLFYAKCWKASWPRILRNGRSVIPSSTIFIRPKHGSDKQLREIVEPIFVKHGVNVALTGHDHFYERIKPQKGIGYLVSGGGGKLREGNVRDNSPLTAKAFDTDMHFMIAEVVGDQLYFQAISRTGETVDSGVLATQRKK